jgi:hypothetical protein
MYVQFANISFDLRIYCKKKIEFVLQEDSISHTVTVKLQLVTVKGMKLQLVTMNGVKLHPDTVKLQGLHPVTVRL